MIMVMHFVKHTP